MEEKEALEHKLPIVDTQSTDTYDEFTDSKQAELPVSGPALGLPVSDQGASSQQPLVAAQVSTSNSDDQSAVLGAEDVDLIEKVWVEKAKAIVQSTHGDPYAQNKELNKIKADYIKKRFGKDVKVSE